MACELGVYGLAVMGVNLALNAASKGFQVCVGNRTPSKVDAALQMAATQGLREKFVGAKDTKEFVRLARSCAVAAAAPDLQKWKALRIPLSSANRLFKISKLLFFCLLDSQSSLFLQKEL